MRLGLSLVLRPEVVDEMILAVSAPGAVRAAERLQVEVLVDVAFHVLLLAVTLIASWLQTVPQAVNVAHGVVNQVLVACIAFARVVPKQIALKNLKRKHMGKVWETGFKNSISCNLKVSAQKRYSNSNGTFVCIA